MYLMIPQKNKTIDRDYLLDISGECVWRKLSTISDCLSQYQVVGQMFDQFNGYFDVGLYENCYSIAAPDHIDFTTGYSKRENISREIFFKWKLRNEISGVIIRELREVSSDGDDRVVDILARDLLEAYELLSFTENHYSNSFKSNGMANILDYEIDKILSRWPIGRLNEVDRIINSFRFEEKRYSVKRAIEVWKQRNP